VAHGITDRTCPAVPYPTAAEAAAVTDPGRICTTTLSDGSPAAAAAIKGREKTQHRKCRDFGSVNTWENHAAYAARHGYTARDSSDLLAVHTDRPPAWSKIKAVQRLLESNQCDWVLWLDADTVIMNSTVPLESLIPSDAATATATTIDLVITTDRRFTANSGSWLLRNSPWSRQFLDDWWNSRGYVRQAGLSLSGDNDAFGHLVRKHMTRRQQLEYERTHTFAADNNHVVMPARCQFNSFGVFLTDKQHADLQQHPDKIKDQEWYYSPEFYHAGDFIAHASGIDQKGAGVEMLLQRAA
jgi:hypothetical protein